MVYFLQKLLIFRGFISKKLIVYQNSVKIHKNLIDCNMILNRGMYGRYLLIKHQNIGLRYGSFVSTKKFTNKPVYKKKR